MSHNYVVIVPESVDNFAIVGSIETVWEYFDTRVNQWLAPTGINPNWFAREIPETIRLQNWMVVPC